MMARAKQSSLSRCHTRADVEVYQIAQLRGREFRPSGRYIFQYRSTTLHYKYKVTKYSVPLSSLFSSCETRHPQRNHDHTTASMQPTLLIALDAAVCLLFVCGSVCLPVHVHVQPGAPPCGAPNQNRILIQTAAAVLLTPRSTRVSRVPPAI